MELEQCFYVLLPICVPSCFFVDLKVLHFRSIIVSLVEAWAFVVLPDEEEVHSEWWLDGDLQNRNCRAKNGRQSCYFHNLHQQYMLEDCE